MEVPWLVSCYFSQPVLGLTIGSGSVESSIKQIGRRIKISGAQWKKENVAQVLKHRCSYLNGYLYSPEYQYSEIS